MKDEGILKGRNRKVGGEIKELCEDYFEVVEEAFKGKGEEFRKGIRDGRGRFVKDGNGGLIGVVESYERKLRVEKLMGLYLNVDYKLVKKALQLGEGEDVEEVLIKLICEQGDEERDDGGVGEIKLKSYLTIFHIQNFAHLLKM